MMLISAWCGVRFGEVTELRRKDVDLDAMQIHILRAVVKVPGIGFIVGETKSEAGVRDIDVPPHIRQALQNHLDQFVGLDPDALLFPAARDPLRHLSQSSRDKVFDRARIVAGRPDLRWHDLRHTGASMSAAAGANLADLKKLMGHSTTDAAMIYQHALDGRGKLIAERLSEMATQTD
jgi:integrase